MFANLPGIHGPKDDHGESIALPGTRHCPSEDRRQTLNVLPWFEFTENPHREAEVYHAKDPHKRLAGTLRIW